MAPAILAERKIDTQLYRYRDKAMTASSEEINYQTSWLLAETSGRAHVTSVLAQIQQQWLIKGQDILELGSGVGTNLLQFAPDNRVRGIEGLESAAREARARGIETQCANLEAPLDIPPKSVGWVFCIDVLEHLVNPRVCLASAAHALRDDGHLVINVPNHFDWRGRGRILVGSGIDSQHYFPGSPHWSYPHVRFFQRKSIEALLNQSGFVVAADFSDRFNTFPKYRQFDRMGMTKIPDLLRATWPDLFSAGFFLVCRKAS